MKKKNWKRGRISVICMLFLLIATFLVSAHGDEEEIERHEEGEEHEEEERLDEKLTAQAYAYIKIATILILLLVAYAVIKEKELHQEQKKIIFLIMLIVTVLATVYSAGTTIYLNVQSIAKGPVHWHADFEIWACGERIDLKESTGFSNRVGSAVFHHHNDGRIHVEGAVLDPSHVTLAEFFSVIGGEITEEHIQVPTEGGNKHYTNGDTCNGSPGKVQIFVYKTQGKVFRQEKEIPEYLLSPQNLVPPGDCIIIEFDQEKERTKHLCASYAVAKEEGEIYGS